MGLFARKGGDGTLYHPGCLAAAKLPHVVKATKEVLRDMGVPFLMIPEFECCGHHAWYAGYEQDFQAIMARNKALLRERGITRIITNDPHCCLTFRERYGVEAKHVLEVFDEHLDKVRKGDEAAAAYHHACFLDKLGIDDKVAVRVLHRANVHVPKENPSRGCCGSVGDDFARNNREAAAKIAERRAKEFREPLLVVACPYCHLSFQKHRKVRDVAEMLAEVR